MANARAFRRRITPRPAAMRVLLLLICCAAAPPATQPATAPALSPEDRAILHQLETGSWRERKLAEAELAGGGSAELPTLRAMLAQTTNPEARARIGAVLDQLNEQALVGPSLITLHLKDAPAASVYAELFQQAHGVFETMPAHLLDAIKPVTLDVDRQPFWTVMQQLQKQTGIGLQRTQDGRCVLVGNAPIASGPQVITDQFLVVLSRVQRIIPSPAGPRTFQADLTFYLEPKSRIMLMTPSIKVEQATDDRGNALTQLRDPERIPGAIRLDWGPIPVVLQLPEKNPGTHLTSLCASLSVSMALRTEHIEVADIMHAAPQTMRIKGILVRCAGCTRKNNLYEIAMTSGPDPQGLLQQIIEDPQCCPRLLDAHGQTLTRVETSTAFHAGGNTITFKYMPSAAPARLTWDIPADIHTVDVPIRFEHVNIDAMHNIRIRQ